MLIFGAIGTFVVMHKIEALHYQYVI